MIPFTSHQDTQCFWASIYERKSNRKAKRFWDSCQ